MCTDTRRLLRFSSSLLLAERPLGCWAGKRTQDQPNGRQVGALAIELRLTLNLATLHPKNSSGVALVFLYLMPPTLRMTGASRSESGGRTERREEDWVAEEGCRDFPTPDSV